MLKKIPVNQLEPAGFLPKRTSVGDLSGLIDTIRRRGDVEIPLVVRPAGNGKYEIAAGYRRWLTAKKAGITHVSCLVREMSDEEMFFTCIVENMHRKELNPIEFAELIQAFKQKTGKDYGEIADMLGISRHKVYNATRLLNLPANIKEKIRTSTNVKLKHALLLTQLKDQPRLAELLIDKIENEKLPTRDLESLIAEMERQKPAARATPTQEPEEPILTEQDIKEIRTRRQLQKYYPPRLLELVEQLEPKKPERWLETAIQLINTMLTLLERHSLLEKLRN